MRGDSETSTQETDGTNLNGEVEGYPSTNGIVRERDRLVGSS